MGLWDAAQLSSRVSVCGEGSRPHYFFNRSLPVGIEVIVNIVGSLNMAIRWDRFDSLGL